MLHSMKRQPTITKTPVSSELKTPPIRTCQHGVTHKYWSKMNLDSAFCFHKNTNSPKISRSHLLRKSLKTARHTINLLALLWKNSWTYPAQIVSGWEKEDVVYSTLMNRPETLPTCWATDLVRRCTIIIFFYYFKLSNAWSTPLVECQYALLAPRSIT